MKSGRQGGQGGAFPGGELPRGLAQMAEGPEGAGEEAVALDAWVEEYLEGRLTHEETARFERALLEPAVAEAFREALVLRDLLASLPPDAPPEELVARIEEALEVSTAEARRKAGRFPRLAAALGGASWALRGPAYAFGTAAGTVSGSAAASVAASGSGPSPVRLGLAPVAALRRGEGGGAKAAPEKARPLWRRVLGRTLGRGRKKEAR